MFARDVPILAFQTYIFDKNTTAGVGFILKPKLQCRNDQTEALEEPASLRVDYHDDTFHRRPHSLKPRLADMCATISPLPQVRREKQPMI